MGNKVKIIEGIVITPLRQIEDARGAVYHVLKNDSPVFTKFGEVYISKVNSGMIKAWKYHTEMRQNFCVPYGKLKLVIYDSRAESQTYNIINEFILSPKDNYNLISIPPKLWYGFQCVSDDFCLLLNVADLKHDPLESIHQNIEDSKIDYQWEK